MGSCCLFHGIRVGSPPKGVLFVLFGVWGAAFVFLNILANNIVYTLSNVSSIDGTEHTGNETKTYTDEIDLISDEDVEKAENGLTNANTYDREHINTNLTKMNLVLRRKGSGSLSFDRKAEKLFYTPSEVKVNIKNDRFIIQDEDLCKDEVFLLIVIPSVRFHFHIRDSIRSSYGSIKGNSGLLGVARTKKYNSKVDANVKLLFFVGRDGNMSTDLALHNESKLNGDIIQADFQDSYGNLTKKILLALRWTTLNCKRVKYLLKADEDVFVNVPGLIRFLYDRPANIKGTIFGHVYTGSQVIRRGRWAVEYPVFPFPIYPDYVAGNSYVISGNAIEKLWHVSEYFHYIHIEDAFVTGILARAVDVKRVNDDRFTYWTDQEPEPCGFVQMGKLTATKVDRSLMNRLWSAVLDLNSVCPLHK